MRFTSVEIENLLAYEDVVRVEFSEPQDDKNVTLIWGRNGMGKTSFLTALKLLFTGIEDEQFRRAGLKAANTAERLYVMGDGVHWLGLFNRRAMARARQTSSRVTARVAATWEDGGRTYQAQRSWSSDDGLTYDHQIVVYDGEDRLVREAATERLEELLPRDFVSFFFFDGEEVKELAEGMGKRAVDVDRLLRLTFVNDVADALDDIAQRRLRGNADGGLADTIDELERDEARAQRQARAAREATQELEDQLGTRTAELAQLQTRRENLAGGSSGALQEDLEARRFSLRTRLNTAIETIAATIPPLAPFYANFGLVSEALRAVDTRLKAAGTAEAALIRAIRENLVEWIQGADVQLSREQQQKIVAALAQRLDDLRAQTAREGPFEGLPLERAEQLHGLLLRWTIAGPVERDVHAAELETARSIQADLEQVEDALMRLEAGSQANLEEYRQVISQIASAEAQVAEWQQRRGQLGERLKEAEATATRCDTKLKELYAKQEQAARNAHEARFIRQVGRTLREFRDALRRTVRAQLERAINQRFFELAYGHSLVARIELNDIYLMNFLDAAGRPIGRGSLSAGLKQLAATALLWAMKDVSGRDFPVVIDTPLGRIDRENQNNLLENYYPKISSQVIVLPTNSEIDGQKLTLLNDHVAKHFLIDNEQGDRAKILPHRRLVEPA